jgi:hypothetical protein
MFIAVLELPYIHFWLVKVIYEKEIKKMTIRQPKILCYLYHVYQILDDAMKRKINYLTNKIVIHGLIRNPYAAVS